MKKLEEFSQKGSQVFTINVMSFGFKHGIPIDADLVFDVRFLTESILYRRATVKIWIEMKKYLVTY